MFPGNTSTASGQPSPGGGELGEGLEHAGDDGGQCKIAVAAVFAVQDAPETETAGEAEKGGDMAMGQGAANGEGLAQRAVDLPAPEQGADAVDNLRGEFGEGGATDALALTFGFAEEDGGRGVAVGDDVDVIEHGGVAPYMETKFQIETPTTEP